MSFPRLYASLLTLWLGFFGWEALGLARAAASLAASSDGLELRARRLQADALEIQTLTREAASRGEQIRYLNNVPGLLPKDQGWLRTRQAIAEEVGGLRRRLASALPKGPYILIDSRVNKLYLKHGFRVLWSADCSVGRGGTLADRRSGRRWQFLTPRGRFRVLGKVKDPEWRKPDWAYVEAGEKTIPPPDDPARLVKGELGAYALNLGGGYLIHGTSNEKALGRPASHGCVRLGAADLERLYRTVPEGTQVFIF